MNNNVFCLVNNNVFCLVNNNVFCLVNNNVFCLDRAPVSLSVLHIKRYLCCFFLLRLAISVHNVSPNTSTGFEYNTIVRRVSLPLDKRINSDNFIKLN